MPELPEVETIVQGLNKTIIDKTIHHVEIFHTKILGGVSGKRFIEFLAGEKILSIKRRGKYILILFTSGKSMVVHLRMTGKFIYSPLAEKLNHKHTRLVFKFTDKSLLYYNDLRIFGTFRLYTPQQEIMEFKKLGKDPFDSQFTVNWLKQSIERKTSSIKNVLLDQGIVSGLGNIYVCEVLFRAKIHPQRAASTLTTEHIKLLIGSIRMVLKQAIKHNGTTINDFQGVDEKTGQFQKLLKVYDREGESCLLCKKQSIVRIKQAQRSTFYCPICQKE